jgi:predicted nucleic acid-binding protein
MVDLPLIDPASHPGELAVSVVTLAELAARPSAATDSDERARPQDRLQRAEATFDPIPFDAEAAGSYGRVYAAVAAGGKKARGHRAFDLMIAATRWRQTFPSSQTRNPAYFEAAAKVVEVVAAPMVSSAT